MVDVGVVDDSCLVKKLSNFMELRPAERELLGSLEGESEDFKPGAKVFSGGDPSKKLFVVKRGWLFAYTMLADGRRQVVRIHYPGDIIGMEGVPYHSRTHDLEAATETTLCPFPKRSLDKIFVESPRLTALLWSVAMTDHAVLLDRLRVLGRMSAIERLAHFYLELRARLALTGEVSDDLRFRVPLTQEVIGDTVGLTSVYVSRTLRMLISLGLIEREGQTIHLRDVLALKELCGFHNRLGKIDIAWFPGANGS